MKQIKEGRLNDKFNQTSNLYNWSFDGKFYPILIEKLPQGNVLFPLSKKSSMQIYKWDGKTKHYTFPTFVALDVDVLANLYDFDYSWFEEQIDLSDVNDCTIDDLNLTALKLISAYDLSSKREFLDLARRIYTRCQSHDICFVINQLQIKARETGLTDSDMKMLDGIETNDVQALFCKNVLMRNKTLADAYYAEMREEERVSIKELPIMKLYSEL